MKRMDFELILPTHNNLNRQTVLEDEDHGCGCCLCAPGGSAKVVNTVSSVDPAPEMPEM